MIFTEILRYENSIFACFRAFFENCRIFAAKKP